MNNNISICVFQWTHGIMTQFENHWYKQWLKYKMYSGNQEFIQLRQLSKAKIELLTMYIPIHIHTNMQIAPPLSFAVPLDHG